MGNVKMANITINNATMLLRLLFQSVPLSTCPLKGLFLTTITKRQEVVLVIIVDPEILYELNC